MLLSPRSVTRFLGVASITNAASTQEAEGIDKIMNFPVKSPSQLINVCTYPHRLHVGVGGLNRWPWVAFFSTTVVCLRVFLYAGTFMDMESLWEGVTCMDFHSHPVQFLAHALCRPRSLDASLTGPLMATA